MRAEGDAECHDEASVRVIIIIIKLGGYRCVCARQLGSRV